MSAFSIAGCLSDDKGPAPTTSPSKTPPVASGALFNIDVVEAARAEPDNPSMPFSYYHYDRVDPKVELDPNLTATNVSIVLASPGSANAPHNFVITELNVKSPDVGKGETKKFAFNVTQAGTYKFFCDKGTKPMDHEALGMYGTLTVTGTAKKQGPAPASGNKTV